MLEHAASNAMHSSEVFRVKIFPRRFVVDEHCRVKKKRAIKDDSAKIVIPSQRGEFPI